jgi:hypothetical protein
LICRFGSCSSSGEPSISSRRKLQTSRRQREPTALVAAGSTIIDSVDQLERHFVPLLKGADRRSPAATD